MTMSESAIRDGAKRCKTTRDHGKLFTSVSQVADYSETEVHKIHGHDHNSFTKRSRGIYCHCE